MGEHLERVVGRIRGRQLGGGQHEHAGDIQSHVAIADHNGALGFQEVDLEVGVVGVAVVPADELGRGVRARKLFAGDPEGAIGRGAGRIDDRVVMLEQLGP